MTYIGDQNWFQSYNAHIVLEIIQLNVVALDIVQRVKNVLHWKILQEKTKSKKRSMLENKRQSLPPKKHGNIPL